MNLKASLIPAYFGVTQSMPNCLSRSRSYLHWLYRARTIGLANYHFSKCILAICNLIDMVKALAMAIVGSTHAGPLQGLKFGGACNTRWGECSPQLVEIRLNDLSKTGGEGLSPPPQPPRLQQA